MMTSSLNKKNDIKYINEGNYINSYIYQPFFIWYSKKSDDELVPQIDKYGYKLYENVNDKEFLENIKIDDDDLEKDRKDIEWFSSEFTKIQYDWNYDSQAKSVFNKLNEQAISLIINEFKVKNNREPKIVYLDSFNDKDVIIQKMNEYLTNNEYDLIAYPILLLKHSTRENVDFYLKSQPLIYDKIDKTFYSMKVTTSSNVREYIKADFLYHLAQKMNIKVRNIKFLILNKYEKTIKKGVVPFKIIEAANGAKSSTSTSINKNSKGDEEDKYLFAQYKNTGEFFSTEKYGKGFLTFMDSIQARKTFSNPTYNPIKVRDASYDKTSDKLFEKGLELRNFDNTIDSIVSAYFEKAPVYSWYGSLSLKDGISKYGENRYKNEIIDLALGSENYYSHNLLKTKYISKEYIDTFIDILYARKQIPNYFSNYAVKLLSDFHIKDKRIVWYDYEGVSSLIPIIDNCRPYQQLTNQVSIIETINGEIIKKNGQISNNIVKDPLNLSLVDLVDNIMNVYSNKADMYVVYSKAYENSRNMDVLKMVEQAYEKDLELQDYFKSNNLKGITDFQIIVSHINNNTFDLRDFFSNYDYNSDELLCFQTNLVKLENRESYDLMRYAEDDLKLVNIFSREEIAPILKPSKGNKIPLINIYELFGKTSIKLVEKLISRNKFDLIYGDLFKEYKNLDIKNGSMAMQTAIHRNLGNITDRVWEQEVAKLKVYCQNDVVMMLVAFSFIEKIIMDRFDKIKEYKFKLSPNQFYWIDINEGFTIKNK
ncbi:UU173 family protein [Mycoplasma sp. Mirounga ES2805-ORL]|uniref:UU173 family protein n=1 Tax=Mycoplasma sp. Mirounga ES2805-ORL TaxID=754514 RepID=UPI00197BDA27|nr:DUF2779 domain-containing protein [Mycoplasma sp. Mirounga ES2805-ORL]QSF13772.1 DUF2779 domain-containing protein [Mycoplasma sp. Mirounga ES2805-ORL]